MQVERPAQHLMEQCFWVMTQTKVEIDYHEGRGMLPHAESGCCAQVFSAMVMSFAHGSNDVANAMGEQSLTSAVPSVHP